MGIILLGLRGRIVEEEIEEGIEIEEEEEEIEEEEEEEDDDIEKRES